MIGPHFGIIPDNNTPFISDFLKALHDLVCGSHSDHDILISSTFPAFRVLSLMNNYNVVIHIVNTFPHFLH